MAKIPCLCGIDVAGDNLCKNSKNSVDKYSGG